VDIRGFFWFAIGLAGLQQAIVEYATGPSADHLMKGTTIPLAKVGDPSSPVTNSICNSQKIKSTGAYQNFSVIGLCCIIVVGGTIMLVSLYVESLVELVQRKMNRGREGRNHWMADSNFQVQRMMYEGRGCGKWRGQKDAVPVYLGGDLQLPVEVDDGRLKVLKRKATEKLEESSSKAKMGVAVETTELSSRSGTATSFEICAAEEAEYQKAQTMSPVVTEDLRVEMKLGMIA
jgi:hypothetical protein